jgi:cytochrome c biogenesis protein
VLFGSTPPVLDDNDRSVGTGDGGDNPSPSSSSPPVWRFAKRVSKRTLAVLSNLPLAIGEMATIGSLMALGKINSMLERLLILG